ncbi:LysR family transcriptional regulator [Janthinobacterium sp. B9-8]|uniref:LysR family transcriptional regulator n=1 Tax=Janthinobacterium sp. B9-8 TaxID=1236179 RepID=UPI00061CE9E0|nr:LysR family transcriptional regulator [Janthinobacterium sp. B9-8]AMC34895.1 transcriptional regulator [Janthinobacterium sp. B9-8]
MALNIDDLQLLIDIVACGSFSQAAARRSWSQPQVSQRVSLLEADIGAQLFQRHRRGVIPTAACLSFLPAVQEALAALEAGRTAIQGAPALPRMTLACMPSLASVVFGPILVALAKAPMEIRCSTDHSQTIMENLLSGKAQLGFIIKCPAVAGIQMERIWRSPIIAVVHKRHPLAKSGQLVLTDIANEQLAPQFWGDGCDQLISQLRSLRSVSGPIHAIQPASAAREMAMEHGFLTFMPEVAVKRDLREGRLIKLNISDLPLWEWEVMMAWRSGKRADISKQRVIDTVRAMAPDWA